jgi:hypothetical protein
MACCFQLENPDLTMALSRLMQTPERTKPFIELLETFGPAFVKRTAAAYREHSLELINGTRFASKPPSRETRSVSVTTAAGQQGRRSFRLSAARHPTVHAHDLRS